MRDARGYLVAHSNTAEMGLLLAIQARGESTFRPLLREAIAAGLVERGDRDPDDPTRVRASLTEAGERLGEEKGWLERCGFGVGRDRCRTLVYTDDQHCRPCLRKEAEIGAMLRWDLIDGVDGLFESEDLEDREDYVGNRDGVVHHHIHSVDGLSCYGDFVNERGAMGRGAVGPEMEVIDLDHCIYPCHETVRRRRDYNIALLSTYP